MYQSFVKIEDQKLIEARFLEFKLDLFFRKDFRESTHLLDDVKRMKDHQRYPAIDRHF